MASVVGFVRDLLFLPPNHDGFVDVARVDHLNLPNEHRDKDCSVCLEPVANQNPGKWVFMHYEAGGQRRLVHPIHLRCIAEVSLATLESPDRILKCPECRAHINFESLCQAVGLQPRIVPKSLPKRMVDEARRIAHRARKLFPLLAPLGCLPITGLLSTLSVMSIIQNPWSITTQTLLKCLVPSVVGGVTGVVLGSFLAQAILHSGEWLIDRMNLQPIPRFIVDLTFTAATMFSLFKIASIAGTALSQLFLKAALSPAQIPQAAQLLQGVWEAASVNLEKISPIIYQVANQAVALDLAVRASALMGSVFFLLMNTFEQALHPYPNRLLVR